MGGTGRIWMFNGFLVLLLVLGFSKLRRDAAAFDTAHKVPVGEQPLDKTPALPPASAAAAPATEAWMDILARHPFSFDRNDINLVPVVVEAPKITPPKPVLFGVVDLGTGRRAMLGDPGARRSTKAVKVGEKFQNWTITKIEPKFVIVENEGVEATVELGNAPIDRDGGKTLASSAPTVVTTSPTPSTPSAPQSPVAPAIGLPPGTQVIAPPGTRVVQTPFGPVVEQVQ